MEQMVDLREKQHWHIEKFTQIENQKTKWAVTDNKNRWISSSLQVSDKIFNVQSEISIAKELGKSSAKGKVLANRMAKIARLEKEKKWLQTKIDDCDAILDFLRTTSKRWQSELWKK